VARRITRLIFLPGGTIFAPPAELAASFLAADRALTPAQRTALRDAARALAAGTDAPRQFCARAADICGMPGEPATSGLYERLAEGAVAQPGMPSLIEELAMTSELGLASDYPAPWLLPALARSGLAYCFPADRIFYIADLGGYPGLFERLVAARAVTPGHTLWVDAHSPRTSEALRRGIDAAIFVDARRLRRDLGLWGLVALPA
jgi:hypothetical protein